MTFGGLWLSKQDRKIARVGIVMKMRSAQTDGALSTRVAVPSIVSNPMYLAPPKPLWEFQSRLFFCCWVSFVVSGVGGTAFAVIGWASLSKA